jgi:hypothetical protein
MARENTRNFAFGTWRFAVNTLIWDTGQECVLPKMKNLKFTRHKCFTLAGRRASERAVGRSVGQLVEEASVEDSTRSINRTTDIWSLF